MFCYNCGKSLPEGARFCDGCGTAMEKEQAVVTTTIPTPAPAVEPVSAPAPAVEPVPAPAPAVEPVPAPYAAPAPAKKSKKGLIIGLVAGSAAVILTVVLLLVFLLPKKYTSPEAVAKDAVIATATYDADTLVDCMPDFMLKQRYGTTNRDTAKKLLRAQAAQAANGNKRTCKVLSAQQVDASEEYADFMEELYYDEEMASVAATIEDFAAVEMTVLVDNEVDEVVVYCGKIDGYWYVLTMD